MRLCPGRRRSSSALQVGIVQRHAGRTAVHHHAHRGAVGGLAPRGDAEQVTERTCHDCSYPAATAAAGATATGNGCRGVAASRYVFAGHRRQRDGRKLAVQRIGLAPEVAVPGAHHHLVAGAAEEVLRRQRHLAVGGVQHVGGHAETGEMTAQTLHDLQPAFDAGAQVGGAGEQLAVEDVVGPHAHAQQPVDQRPHHAHVIVYAFEQYRLVAERNAGPEQPVARPRRLRGELAAGG